jgi:hypothetical protein
VNAPFATSSEKKITSNDASTSYLIPSVGEYTTINPSTDSVLLKLIAKNTSGSTANITVQYEYLDGSGGYSYLQSSLTPEGATGPTGSTGWTGYTGYTGYTGRDGQGASGIMDIFADFGQNIVNYNYNTFSLVQNILQANPTNLSYPYYTSVSTSASGQYQMTTLGNNGGVAGNNGILLSTSYGMTWTKKQLNTSNPVKFTSSAISSSGKYQIAVSNVSSLSGIPGVYISTNYGVDFSSNDTSSLGNQTDFTSTSMSASGQYILITVNRSSNSIQGSTYGAYLSNNFGEPSSWSAITSIPFDASANYTSCAVSGSGQYQLIGSNSTNSSTYLYKSIDFGTTWTSVSSISSYTISISISASGQYQVVGTNTNLYISRDYGLSWSSVSYTSTSYKSVSISASGQYIGVISNNDGSLNTNYVNLSYDFGNNFYANTSLNFSITNVTNYGIYISPFGQNITVVSGNNSLTSSTYDNIYVWNQASSYSNLRSYTDVSNNTVGSSNTVFGTGALPNYLAYGNTGSYNTAFGNETLKSNTAGYQNTAVGRKSLKGNTAGWWNGAFGDSSLENNTTGYNNNAVGVLALGNNTTGYNNTAIGLSSLVTNTTGNSNTAIGAYTDVSNNNYNNSTAIGAYAKITASNQIVLGTSSETVIIPGTLNVLTSIGDSLRYIILSSIYPVGSIYMNYTSSSNPNTVLNWPSSYSTWTAIAGSNVLTSYNATDASFSLGVAGNTADVAPHNHQWIDYVSTSGNYTIDCTGSGVSKSWNYDGSVSDEFPDPLQSDYWTDKAITSNTTNGNYPPYTTVAMWRRTA